ncbi:TPA: phage tail protein [Acinetobacter baumannii]|uniref:phage tail protein n=1 Tax=Acinetobacter baumannii TaxID=470 RepID=UPI000A344D6D|nr:phage tail protein [Acinetobacter baumannii]AYY53195.1 phage tail protein [Acinetobacter baumannii]MCZ3059774.1 phage tail protein [Acinetobacter baumannii]OTM25166.1 phage tail protein [Acinetobacter baumannii]HEE5581473.1 phage tail protein [Acinetobacter baumannii]HEE5773986.1 phage tail protein [Acinetobacter baumannii]
MANNNRVEVHVGAKTSELKEGMQDAEKIVSDSAKKIESTGHNIDFKLDLSNLRSELNGFASNLSDKFKTVGNDFKSSLTNGLSLVRGGFFLGIGQEIARSAAEAVAAIPDLVSAVGKASKELEIQARLANSNTLEFQEWAFAAKKVGVEQDKLSDIMKDVNDKFGDFMQTGGGEMADFFEKIAPKVGVTAKEFQGLSGPQILEKYHQTLQKANVSQAEMTFYMDSLADDATLLAPLLDNNAEKLKEYAKQAHDLGVIMSSETMQSTKEFNTALETIHSTVQGVMSRMAAQAAPALTDLANRFLNFAVESKEGIDDSIKSIISIFGSFFSIVEDIFNTIGGIWQDLTSNIGDGSVAQIGFMDAISVVLRALGVVVTGFQVGVQSAFAIIRAVVVTVCQALIIAFNGLMAGFDMVRSTIQYGLDVLQVKFQTFGSVVNNILHFNFSGAKAAWEGGLSQLGSITDRYTNQMKGRMADLKNSWNAGATTAANSLVTAGKRILEVTTAGNQKITNYVFKDPTKPVEPPKPPKLGLGTAPPNTKLGIGTGEKDEKGGSKSSAKSKAEQEAKERQRQAEQAAKALADIRYKYASEEKKVALDLQKALDEIEKSKMTADEKAAAKVKAEKDASDKIIAIRLKEFEEYKKAREEQIDNYQQQAQRLYEIEASRIQAEFDAKKISNVRKVQLEKQLEDQLREIKRQGLLERLALENEQTNITGKQGNQNQITNNISDLETDQKVADTKSMGLISDAEMKDFEAKFGGFTSRLSNLWDQGIQSLMNGTLTWSNATKAVLADMGAFALQTATKELQDWLKIQAIKLARKLGFVGAETAAEASGQAAQTGATIAGEATRTSVTAAGGLARLGLKAAEAIKGIMMSAWEAMAGAFKAMVAIPYVGPILAVGAGAAAFGLVAGLAGKIKSARGGYDIPSGVNPVTQLHEDEMVLPSQHANTIREMGKALRNGASFGAAAVAEGGGAGATINISAIDAKSIQRLLKSNGRAVASGLQSYARGFGKNGK